MDGSRTASRQVTRHLDQESQVKRSAQSGQDSFLGRDSDEHGTHCAGTLVGGVASGRQIGVAPDARLAAALVLNGDDGGTDAQILRGIDWCLEQEVDVISMSLGGLVMDAETPPTYSDAILTCLE